MPVVAFQTVGGNGSGEAYTKLETRYRLLMSLLQMVTSGEIVRVSGGGLNCGMLASPDGNFDYWLNGTKYQAPEDDTFALTASVANHISVDSSQVLEKTAGAWPGGDHWKLAIVTCDGSEITAMKDCRMENVDPAAANGWYNITAAGDVDLAGFDLKNIGELDPKAHSELTISSGSITPTQMLHTVDTESDAASDNLDTLVATSGKRSIVILVPENSGRVVTILSSGNILLSHGSSTYAFGATDMICLIQNTDTTWKELFRNESDFSKFSQSIDANEKPLTDVASFGLHESQLTISSGVVAVTRSLHTIDTESDAASDDLDTLGNGIINGALLILRAEHTDRTVVVKDGTGDIQLANNKDFSMTSVDHTLTLRYRSSNTTWYEVSRSHSIGDFLVGGGKNFPYFVQVVAGTNLSGVALSARVLENRVELPYAGVIEKVTGHVNSAPSGTACIVDVKINGSSIFANQGEMVNIAAAAKEDVSATKDHAFSAGDYMTIEVQQLSSADDLVIVPHILVDAQTAP